MEENTTTLTDDEISTGSAQEIRNESTVDADTDDVDSDTDDTDSDSDSTDADSDDTDS